MLPAAGLFWFATARLAKDLLPKTAMGSDGQSRDPLWHRPDVLNLALSSVQ
jgi:hypothetical protein